MARKKKVKDLTQLFHELTSGYCNESQCGGCIYYDGSDGCEIGNAPEDGCRPKEYYFYREQQKPVYDWQTLEVVADTITEADKEAASEAEVFNQQETENNN